MVAPLSQMSIQAFEMLPEDHFWIVHSVLQWQNFDKYDRELYHAHIGPDSVAVADDVTFAGEIV
jgi:hypothetical protein